MTSIDFEESNIKIAEDQEQYETLIAHHNKEEGSMTFCFKLNKEEMDEINKTGVIWFKQLTFGKPMNPVSMSTEKNDLIY